MSLFQLRPFRPNAEQNYNHPENKNSWRYKLYEIIFQAYTFPGKLFDVLLFVLIFTNIIVLMMESIPTLGNKYTHIFQILDWIYMILFSVEYVLRVICVRKASKYIFSYYGIIDLLAIIPSYLTFILPQTHMLMLIRGFRLLRIFRIFNMVNFLNESSLLLFSIVRSFRKILIFLFFVVLLCIFFGTVMYVLEVNRGSGFTSIPQSIYWAIVTITTVGYGDIAPVTALGKMFASFMMILGYAIIAVPTGILSSDLTREYVQKKNKKTCTKCGTDNLSSDVKFCPNCGSAMQKQSS